MGNTGGFSAGPSTSIDGLSVPEHGDAEVEVHLGYQQRDIPERQLQDLARKFDVSKTEMQLLWYRFRALGPSDSGLLSRGVFQRPPYSEDIFCRQIWKRFSGSRGAPHQISFSSFARSMIWWQKASTNSKIELLFSWMTDVDGITPHILSKILKHVLSDYQEEELQQIAEKMITTINPSADPPVVKQNEFQQWMGQLPEETLRHALDFTILHTNAGT